VQGVGIADPSGGVALVAGGTRGAGRGIAVALGEAGVSVFYDLAKVAVTRLAFSQAHDLRPYGGTAVALTPGWLRSEMMLDAFGVTEATWREATRIQPHFCSSESPAFVGRAVTALAADPDVGRWSGQSLSSGQLAGVYGFTDVDGTRPDCAVHRRGAGPGPSGR
jgi:NAD(P)-dependent dehydrogenase (short-subunit alcohol dehydrogenase family)